MFSLTPTSKQHVICSSISIGNAFQVGRRITYFCKINLVFFFRAFPTFITYYLFFDNCINLLCKFYDIVGICIVKLSIR